MYTNTSCTIYLEKMDYQPMVIPHCFLTQTSRANYIRTGKENDESAFVMFKGDKDIQFSKGKDRLIEGLCDITIPKEQPARSKAFEELQKRGCYTVMRADYKGYGSKHMRHWELSCK